MIFRHKKNRRGFTLTELVIVLGVFTAIIAGLWSLVSLTRQKTHVAQTLDAIAYTADAVRSVYGSQSSITAGYPALTAALTAQQAIPSNLVRSNSSTCSGTTGNFADIPWSVTYNVCGTFHVCAWNYGTTKKCSTTAISTGQQFFAIELTQLDYGSCIALASGVYPTHPPGLVDVYVANTGAVADNNEGLPAPTSWATGVCSTSSNNTVDFVYRLRPPVS